MDAVIGQAAALLVALSFSITSVCYTLAGRKLTAVTSIALSLPVSGVLLLGVHRVTQGVWLPVGASPQRWAVLGISGILAFVISNFFMLKAYQQIGPRLTMLVASFAPIGGALLAWFFLGQALPANTILGIAVVTAGVVWVVLERSQERSAQPGAHYTRGLGFATLGTLTQSAAFVFATLGVAGAFAPFSATLIRIIAGVLATWAVLVAQGKVAETVAVVRGDARLLWLLLGAAITGPVIAGTLLMVALQLIPVGVATTLSHTTSIMLIPIGYVVFGERVTLRAVLGTAVAIAGIALLFV